MALDLTELLSADEASLPEKLAAYRNALTRTNNAGIIAALSGNQQLGEVGKLLGHQYVAGQAALNKVPEERQQMALRQEQLQKSAEANAARNHPATGQVLRQTLARYTGQPETAFADLPPQTAEFMLPIAEKAWAAQQAADARRDTAQYQRDARAGADLDREYRLEMTTQQKLRQALDPTVARGGAYGRAYQKIQAANALQALVSDPEKLNGIRSLNNQQVYEAARALDNLISGGSPTVSGTAHLVPSSLAGNIQGLMQFITNEVQTGALDNFVQNMNEAAMREREVWQKDLDETQRKRAGSFSAEYKRFPASTAATLESMGIDPTTVQGHPYYKPPSALPNATGKGSPGAKSAPKAVPVEKRAAGYLTED